MSNISEDRYLLINPRVLPPVFENVIRAKELLSLGKATSAAQAAKMAGISRSAFYKYKDFVFKYSAGNVSTINLSAVLSDRAGVFSALTAALYRCGANIITLNAGSSRKRNSRRSAYRRPSAAEISPKSCWNRL